MKEFRPNQPIVRICPNGYRIIGIYKANINKFLVLKTYNNIDYCVTAFEQYSLGLDTYYSYDTQTYSELKESLEIIESNSVEYYTQITVQITIIDLIKYKKEIMDSLLEYRKEKLNRILKNDTF